MLKLLERPQPDDLLRAVYDQGKKLFHKYSGSLPSVSDCHRQAVMSDPTW
jgi:hypothetical protein